MRKSGFTFVVLRVSLLIFAILLGGIIYAFGVEYKTWQRVVRAHEKQQIENAVFLRISGDIRSASEVLPGSYSKLLRLKIGPDTFEYSLANKKVKRKKNNYSSYLTIEEEIQGLEFAYPEEKLVGVNINGRKTNIYLRN
jgi:hypothetical protein